MRGADQEIGGATVNQGVIDLVQTNAAGILHLGGSGVVLVSAADMARRDESGTEAGTTSVRDETMMTMTVGTEMMVDTIDIGGSSWRLALSDIDRT